VQQASGTSNDELTSDARRHLEMLDVGLADRSRVFGEPSLDAHTVSVGRTDNNVFATFALICCDTESSLR